MTINWALYARGTSLGSYLGGFRLRTRYGQQPGPAGLILAALTFLCTFVVAAAIAVSFTPNGSSSGSVGRPESHPLSE